MNRGLFEAQVNDAWDILRGIGIGAERILMPQFPDNPRTVFKGLKYAEIWELTYKEQFYNFRLEDDSLIQFRVDSFRPPMSIHYAYYECPFEPRISLEEFEEKHPLSAAYDWLRLTQDYDNYVSAANKETVTPIRYDYDPGLYTPCVHPASHIHFGHNSSIRVGTRKVLKPLSFVLLIIRQIYPDQWGDLMGLRNSDELCRNIRGSLDNVDDLQWDRLHDERQLYLI